MGFGKLNKLNIKLQNPTGRGTFDVETIEDAIRESWEELQEGLEEQEAGVLAQIQDHFNKFNDECNLGNYLYGDSDDFFDKVHCLNAEEKMAFFDELFEQGIFDKQNLVP